MSEYPGEIVDDVFRFRELKYKDVREKSRVFRVFVRIIKEIHHIADANWNVLDETTMPFDEEYLRGKELPKNCAVQYWTEYGEINGKITMSAPKYPKVGKKATKTLLQQAMSEALSIYTKKKKTNVKSDIVRDSINPMVFPMLADKKTKKINYPVFCQAKLDGNRCIAFIDQKNDVILYTRGLKLWPKSPAIDRVRDSLKDILISLRVGERSLYLDGELYVHGLSLEEIAKVRASDYSGPVKYNIFDCFDFEKPAPFEKRWNTLLNYKEALNSEPLELIETICINNAAEENAYYESCLERGYEGIMIRNPQGIYKFSTHKNSSRSSDLIKRKPLFDAEFKVIGFTSGKKGKDANTIVWICATDSGESFHVTPKGKNYEEKRAILKECETNFAKKYENRMMKVEFGDLSESGIPLRAKAVGFRDFE